MEKKNVRFPNESYFTEIEIDMSRFRPEITFGNETFGWYGDLYISIKSTN